MSGTKPGDSKIRDGIGGFFNFVRTRRTEDKVDAIDAKLAKIEKALDRNSGPNGMG